MTNVTSFEAAVTVDQLIASLMLAKKEGALTGDTPLAVFSDPEGNRLSWLDALSRLQVRYAPDQRPYSLDEPDPRVPYADQATTALAFWPAR